MKRFVMAGVCAALLVPGCGNESNLVPARGTESSRAFVPQADTTGTVGQVDSQERLLLGDGRRVTLRGIELQTGGDACAVEARAYLERLTVGQTVSVDVCDVPGAAASGDLAGLVVVTTPGREAFVNVEMLRAGFAQLNGASLEACGLDRAQRRLDDAQSEAQAAARGAFGSGQAACSAAPPAPEPVAGIVGAPTPRPMTSPFPRTGPSPGPSPVPIATPAPLASPSPVMRPSPITSPSPAGSPTAGGTIGPPPTIR